MKFEHIMAILAVMLVATLLLTIAKAGHREDLTEKRWDALKDAFAEWFLLPAKETKIIEKNMCTASVSSVPKTPSCLSYDNRGEYCMIDCAGPGIYQPGSKACYNGTTLISVS